MMEKFKEKLRRMMAETGIWLLKNCGKGSDVALYAVGNEKSVVLVDVSKGDAAVVWNANNDVAMIFGAAVTPNNYQRICLTSAMDTGDDNVKHCRRIMKNAIKSGHLDRMNAVLGQMRGTTYPPLRTPKISDLH